MENYVGHLLTVLVMLSGLAGAYTKIIARIQILETRLQIDDASKVERDRARRLEMASIARTVYENEYGVRRGNTNPHIQIPG